MNSWDVIKETSSLIIYSNMDMMQGTQINWDTFQTQWIIANVVLACYWMINGKMNTYNYRLDRTFCKKQQMTKIEILRDK